jgi:septal ring factor EnvC (AmiA/AmiB activator)
MKALSARTGGILFGLLAAALVALAIFSVVKTDDLNTKISSLEDQVSLVEGQTAKLAKSTGNDAEEELQALEHKLRKVEACIPEVQNEINGLGVEVEAGFAYIENNSQVSTYCQSVVYPQSQGEP